MNTQPMSFYPLETLKQDARRFGVPFLNSSQTAPGRKSQGRRTPRNGTPRRHATPPRPVQKPPQVTNGATIISPALPCIPPATQKPPTIASGGPFPGLKRPLRGQRVLKAGKRPGIRPPEKPTPTLTPRGQPPDARTAGLFPGRVQRQPKPDAPKGQSPRPGRQPARTPARPSKRRRTGPHDSPGTQPTHPPVARTSTPKTGQRRSDAPLKQARAATQVHPSSNPQEARPQTPPKAGNNPPCATVLQHCPRRTSKDISS